MVPTRHSSSIFRPYPAEPYINRKLSVWAFQRCIVRLQQSSFGPDLPGLLLTVNILGHEGNQLGRVIIYPKSPVHVSLQDVSCCKSQFRVRPYHDWRHPPIGAARGQLGGVCGGLRFLWCLTGIVWRRVHSPGTVYVSGIVDTCRQPTAVPNTCC